MGLVMKLVGGLGLSKVKLVILAVVLTIIAGQFVTIKFLHSKNQGLSALAAAETQAHLTTKASFDAYRDNSEAQAARTERSITDLASSHHDAQSEIIELRKLLQTHDLAKLMRAKPGLIEKRINAETRRLFSKINWSTEDEILSWLYLIESDPGLPIHPSWLRFASGNKAYGSIGPAGPADLPSPGQAQPGRPSFHGPGKEARAELCANYRFKVGVGLPGPAPIRNFSTWFLRPYGLYA